MIRLLILLFTVLSISQACSQEGAISQSSAPAFPGADGYGKFTTGGRGGKVFVVTNLNDSGPGSFREAVKKKEKRIVVFAISGTISLESDINITSGDLTIAGQSAPGDGICIRNYQVKIDADNVIIRYMRFRMGDERKVQGDALGSIGHRDIMIDHCSISWATDECASFYKNKNFTMQWCIISESLNHSIHEKGDHGYGGIWGGEPASFHHNLIVHHNSRLPRFSGSSTTPNSPYELVDFWNNVVYNWMGNGSYGGEKGRYNIVGNYYKPGPATSKSKAARIVNPLQPYGKFFVSENFVYGSAGVTSKNSLGIYCNHVDSVVAGKPFESMHEKIEDPPQALAAVLSDAGASRSRDAVDARIAAEVEGGTATYGTGAKGIIDSQKDVGGWPELRSEAAAKDSDLDGMPDDWEQKHQLKSADASDGNANTLSKGYTNIEVYLNELAEKKR